MDAESATHVVRALVVDDEPSAREAVRSMLAEHPRIAVVGEATNGREAVKLVHALKPDLIFLDIQMPDLDGFGVLETLGPKAPRGIVFVTAHDEHAIRAFDVHALDYLLKPFGRPRFRAAVERALQGLEALDALDAITLQRTLDSMAADRSADRAPAGELSLGATPSTARRIGVRNGAKTTLVEISEIDWVEASGDYARIHVGPKVHLVLQPMHALERLLDSHQFVRIHRSLLVQVARVQALHREADGGGSLILKGEVRLRVSRSRWAAVARALEMQEL